MAAGAVTAPAPDSTGPTGPTLLADAAYVVVDASDAAETGETDPR
jgi:hypothetical protein